MKIINAPAENSKVVKNSCWTVRVIAAPSLSPATSFCLLAEQIKSGSEQPIKKVI